MQASLVDGKMGLLRHRTRRNGDGRGGLLRRRPRKSVDAVAEERHTLRSRWMLRYCLCTLLHSHPQQLQLQLQLQVVRRWKLGAPWLSGVYLRVLGVRVWSF